MTQRGNRRHRVLFGGGRRRAIQGPACRRVPIQRRRGVVLLPDANPSFVQQGL